MLSKNFKQNRLAKTLSKKGKQKSSATKVKQHQLRNKSSATKVKQKS